MQKLAFKNGMILQKSQGLASLGMLCFQNFENLQSKYCQIVRYIDTLDEKSIGYRLSLSPHKRAV